MDLEEMEDSKLDHLRADHEQFAENARNRPHERANQKRWQEKISVL